MSMLRARLAHQGEPAAGGRAGIIVVGQLDLETLSEVAQDRAGAAEQHAERQEPRHDYPGSVIVADVHQMDHALDGSRDRRHQRH
jgi:hypothetical protein